MSNMSYCRFENTLNDLDDCFEHMGDNDYSDSEKDYRERMIDMCVDIALEYGYEIGRGVEESTENEED